jgi:phenylpyruvate tautomerase PptA (4-oxalocrotonate tautomerase family)
MPLYICTTPKGMIAENAKPPIAKKLTQIHCDVTDAPPTFVHVFFLQNELDPEAPASLFGSIRAGRTEGQKKRLCSEMEMAVSSLAGIPLSNISMSTVDVPAKWVMEGGALLPEPGDEEAWLAEHHS